MHTIPDGALPLTAAQSGIWYAQRLDPDNAVFNTGEYVVVDGPFDPELVTDALRRVVAEAECLRLRFAEGEQGPYAVLTDPEWTLRVSDLRALDDPEQEARTAMRAALALPKDPTTDRLFDFALFRVADDRHLLFYSYHHIVVDGFTVALLTRRLAEVYSALAEDTDVPENPFPPLRELVDAEAAYRDGERYAADREHFVRTLEGRTAPATLARTAPAPARGLVRRTAFLDPATATGLRDLAHTLGASLPPVLMAAAALYLRSMTGRDDILLGVPVSTRLGKLARSVPGMVSNVVPLRLDAAGELSLAAFVEQTSGRLRESMRHQRYRFEDMRRDLRMVGSDERVVGPEVNIMMFDYDLTFGPSRGVVHNLSIGPSDDLSFVFYQRSDGRGMQVDFDANPDLYDEAELAGHQRRFLDFLQHVADSAPERELHALGVLGDTERRLVVEKYNDTTVEVEPTTLTALLESARDVAPEATALVAEESATADGTAEDVDAAEDTVVTYRELHERADRLAQYLRSRGIGRESVVGAAIPRSAELVVALLGILKAGAAYLPLDPDYPAERVRMIVDDARPALVLTTTVTAVTLADELSTEMLALDTPAGQELLDEHPATPIDVSSGHPDDPAYVIYTSGSTGKPKGVVVPHRGIVNRLLWMQHRYGLTTEDVVLQKTPSGFDVSVWEFFWPLLRSATLVLAKPGGHKDPDHLVALCRRLAVTTIHFVPSMLRAFLAARSVADCRSLRRVLCSGEALPRELVEEFFATFDRHDTELHNLYGPTEASVDVTSWECARGSGLVPIGKPVWNTRAYVLDGTLRPVATGVPGELYLAGVQLARGYLGRAGLTAERFVADPFGPPGSVMYRTGDLAHWDERGVLLYAGRVDDQVKIRGNRVELDEVAGAVAAHPDIAAAEVVLREDRPGDQRLIGYVIPAEGRTVDATRLRAHVATRLPDYMIPSALVEVAEFPLTPNGKLDRRALPAPEVPVRGSGGVPENPRQEILCGLFADALGVPRVGIRDNFFDAGGHSLLATRLITRVNATFGTELSIRALFEAPTVADLSVKLADGDDTGSPLDVLLPLRPSGSAPGLFCLHPAGGLSWCYSGLIRHLDPDIPVYGLQARGLDGDEVLPESLEEMAEDYLEQIRSVQPHGPYHLLGYSSGGILAHLLASMLEQQGEPVGLVTVLDTYPGQSLAELGEQEVLADLLGWVGYDRRYLGRSKLKFSEVIKILRKLGSSMATLKRRHITALAQTYARCRELVHSSELRKYSGDILVIVAALDKLDISPTPATWEPYVGGEVRVRTIDYRHNDLMKPGPLAEIGGILADELTADRFPNIERV